MEKQYQDFLNKLKLKRRHGQWTKCLCPGHDDHHPSLDVRLDRETGIILINCWAGCEPEQVVAAMGLQMRDLRCNKAG
jgi:hypothetical protein